MTRVVVRAALAALALAVTVMLLIVAVGWSPRVEYVLATSVVAVFAFVALQRLLGSVAAPAWPPAAPAGHEQGATDPRISAIETTLRRSIEDAGACRRRVQPLLLDLAIHRLSHHRGVGLVGDPEEAQRLLGDEAFRFLGEVVDEPTTVRTLTRTVTAIEKL